MLRVGDLVQVEEHTNAWPPVQVLAIVLDPGEDRTPGAAGVAEVYGNGRVFRCYMYAIRRL